MEVNGKTLTLWAAIVALIILTIIFWARSEANVAKADAANEMSTALVGLLTQQGYQRAYPACRTIAPGNYPALEACLQQAKQGADLTTLFERSDLQKPDAKRNLTGYIVIENTRGGRTFASANFTLSHNNQEIAQGCVTPGDIAPGYTCRFDFTQPCAAGDNLEIKYDGQRAYLETC